jgi:abortive infection bacteriophage resistance protein
VGLTFSKKDPVGKGWVYGTWTSDFLANETIDFNPKLQISKIQRNSQRIYPEPLVLSRFFEETSQSFEFFSNTQNLKLLSSEVLMKAQHTGFA